MKPRKKFGVWVTTAIVMLSLCGIAATFMANASQYVNIKQAKSIEGDSLHLVGTIELKTVQTDSLADSLQFTLKDLNGETIKVQYHGEPIANIQEAKKVVAIGGIEGGVFVSHQLLIKCPSKYNDGKGASQLLSKPSADSNAY